MSIQGKRQRNGTTTRRSKWGAASGRFERGKAYRVLWMSLLRGRFGKPYDAMPKRMRYVHMWGVRKGVLSPTAARKPDGFDTCPRT